MPNGLGGFGLPRYIKQPLNYSPNYYDNSGEEWAANESTDSNQQEIEIPSREQELSPTATEYTPPKSASGTPTAVSSTTTTTTSSTSSPTTTTDTATNTTTATTTTATNATNATTTTATAAAH